MYPLTYWKIHIGYYIVVQTYKGYLQVVYELILLWSSCQSQFKMHSRHKLIMSTKILPHHPFYCVFLSRHLYDLPETLAETIKRQWDEITLEKTAREKTWYEFKNCKILSKFLIKSAVVIINDCNIFLIFLCT